ncbi:MAG TPA: hypothetical protein VN714_27240 [Trebonia sp.]|jgi:hypothetical protein|nr:hypothetical protein [Trebonia sp.]
MDEFRALQVVAALRSRGVNADLYQENGLYGVRVSLADEREAELDTNGTEPDAEAMSPPVPDQGPRQASAAAGALG